MNLNEFKEKVFAENPEVRAEYDALGPQYDAVRAQIDAGIIPEEISIDTDATPDSGTTVYYDCCTRHHGTGCAYLVVSEGKIIAKDSWYSKHKSRAVELETAIAALENAPANMGSIRVITSCKEWQYNILNNKSQPQHQKRFNNLKQLIEEKNAQFCWRSGNWGDLFAALCRQTAERASVPPNDEAKESENEDDKE